MAKSKKARPADPPRDVVTDAVYAVLAEQGLLGPDDRHQIRVESRECLVELDQTARASAGVQLAATLEALDEAAAERKQIMADLKSQTEEIQKDRRRFQRMLTEGKDTRPLDCFVLFNRSRATVSIVRPDTLEVVENRPMTADEKQGLLFGEPE